MERKARSQVNPIAQTEVTTRSESPQESDYSLLIARAIKESTPPLIGRGHRLLSSQRGWGSKHAVTVDGVDVRVGYRDPLVNATFTGILLKNEPNPRYGIRVGNSDQVYRNPEQIAQQLGEHARDAVAPILYELAQQQSKLTHDTIQQAEDLGAVTIATSTRPDGSTYGAIYLADGATGKMVRFESDKPTTSDFLPNDISEVRKILREHQTVQDLLREIPDQAVNMKMVERDGKPVLEIRTANGNNWIVGNGVYHTAGLDVDRGKKEGKVPEKTRTHETGNEYLLFGPLGRGVYDLPAQQRIEQKFGSKDSKPVDCSERLKMFENYGRLKVGVSELLRTTNMDVLQAERRIIQTISPLAKKNVERSEGLEAHLSAATVFAEQLVLNTDGTSKFPSLFTDRQAQLLAYVITPSHDLMKYMAAPNGEDFTADHQALAADFIRSIHVLGIGAKINLGTKENPNLTELTQEDADFIAGVVGDHENILREGGRREFIHSENPIERAKAVFFIIDVLTGVIQPSSTSGGFTLDRDQLRTRFTDLYVRHMNASTRKVFRPQWGSYAVEDIVETLGVLQTEGLKLPGDTNLFLIKGALAAFPLTHVDDPKEKEVVILAREQLTSLYNTEIRNELKLFLNENSEASGVFTFDSDSLSSYFEEGSRWSVGNVRTLFNILNEARASGMTILKDSEGRSVDQALVAAAMNVVLDVKERISTGELQVGGDFDPKSLSNTEKELRRIGMEQLVKIGVLKSFPKVQPIRTIPDPDNRGKYIVEGGPEDYEVIYDRNFAILVRDLHIQSATARSARGVSSLLSGDYETAGSTSKIIFVAGNTEKENLFPGIPGSEVYKYTTPVEIEAIKHIIESELAKDPNFEFKRVVSLSMGAKYAGENPDWLNDMTPYLRQQIDEGGVFLIGSTDSNLAGPLLTKIKQLGGKSIGVVPEGPVIFPGYAQDNTDYAHPSAALPVDVTVVVQAGKTYDGCESPYFVQVALTEALAEGRMLEIGMVNGGKLTLLDEVARLLDAEARRPELNDEGVGIDLNSSLMLVSDAGRGSQLLSVLIERQRTRMTLEPQTTTKELIDDAKSSVEKLIEDLERIVADSPEDREQTDALLEELGYKDGGLHARDDAKAFLMELKKDKPPFATALRAALISYNEYIDRHQLGDSAVLIVTTKQLNGSF